MRKTACCTIAGPFFGQNRWVNGGNGPAQLVEIPTDDKIVAYCVPESAVTAGSEWAYRYNLNWCADEFWSASLAGRVIATRLRKGGILGQPRPPGSRKFAIDFEGGAISP